MKLFKSILPLVLFALVLGFSVGCDDNSTNDPVAPSTGPGAPMLVAPADATVFGAESTTFDWNDATDAVAYQLQVSTNAGFSNLVVDDQSLTASTKMIDLSTIGADGDYFWRVRAVDGGDNWGEWSGARQFTLETVVILMGTIRENMTLVSSKEYLLSGGVFIGGHYDATKSVTLTIEAGTTIYGESATDGMLVVARGGKIMAEGTANAPIVFTSDQPIGQRARADWGGVIINGWAPLNTGEFAEGEGNTGPYGGTIPDDNSGMLKYVRIEFAGREISPDNELNGLALQGVGNGTTIDYVQVHMNKDDGIEFFGGTVNAKHMYVTGCADDQFDWTDGWRGKGQFWVCQQYGDDADQGIEADNSGEDNDATPRSAPTLYNLTLIGDMPGAESDIGMLLREGTGVIIRNAIVMNFGDCGIDIDHIATFNNGWDFNNDMLSGNLVVNNCIFYDNNEAAQSGEDDEAGFPFTSDNFIREHNVNNRFTNPILMAAYNKSTPDYRPADGSIATSGYATPPNDGFFETVNYIGAVSPTNNWLAGWTTSAQN